MRNLLLFLFFMFLLSSVAGFAIFYWYSNAIILPNGISTANVVFEIKQGDGVDEIADNLVTEGIIKDRWAFWLHAKLNSETVDKFQAGYFELTPQDSVVDLFVIFQKAKNKDDVRITIVEGLRVDEIGSVIDKEYQKNPGNKFVLDDFLRIVNDPDEIDFSNDVRKFLDAYKPEGKNLEGYLFPDTYFFSKDAEAIDVIEKMVITLFNKLEGSDYSSVSNSSYNLNQLLTIASMIEREASSEEEKSMIADIIYKRLDEGVNGVNLLQVDATLLYIAKDWKADAYRYKESTDPYNTYKYEGLPPGPICNPGIDAIRGALSPTSNDYFFYIHDAAGKIHYAETYSDHLINVDMYLK